MHVGTVWTFSRFWGRKEWSTPSPNWFDSIVPLDDMYSRLFLLGGSLGPPNCALVEVSIVNHVGHRLPAFGLCAYLTQPSTLAALIGLGTYAKLAGAMFTTNPADPKER